MLDHILVLMNILSAVAEPSSGHIKHVLLVTSHCVYVVFQSLQPLDPSRLFGWQAANTLNSTGKQFQGHCKVTAPVNTL